MGTPGFPPTRVLAVPDKRVRPIRRLTDLTVSLADLICGPEDLRRLGMQVKISDGGAAAPTS